MKEEKLEEIKVFSKQNDINIVNIKNIKKNGKTRIVIDALCKQCKTRYNIRYDTLKNQRFKGLCTKCAHLRSSEYKLLSVENLIQRFENEGYTVITPKPKIKRRGNKTVYFTPVDIKNKYGDIYTVNCNNFFQNIEYYRDLNNCDYKEQMLKAESRLECKVRMFLEEQKISYKQQFRFTDCRGKKYPLPFDFCLFYKTNKIILIEVDGEMHFDKRFTDLQKNDRIKNYYCKSREIPLLRLSYREIDNEKNIYKDRVLDFISQNR